MKADALPFYLLDWDPLVNGFCGKAARLCKPPDECLAHCPAVPDHFPVISLRPVTEDSEGGDLEELEEELSGSEQSEPEE